MPNSFNDWRQRAARSIRYYTENPLNQVSNFAGTLVATPGMLIRSVILETIGYIQDRRDYVKALIRKETYVDERRAQARTIAAQQKVIRRDLPAILQRMQTNEENTKLLAERALSNRPQVYSMGELEPLDRIIGAEIVEARHQARHEVIANTSEYRAEVKAREAVEATLAEAREQLARTQKLYEETNAKRIAGLERISAMAAEYDREHRAELGYPSTPSKLRPLREE